MAVEIHVRDALLAALLLTGRTLRSQYLKSLEEVKQGFGRRRPTTAVSRYREWIGTVDGFVNAEIKAQISGYLVKQEYIKGLFVRQGQLLFQIDPRPFQADLDQAEGRLAQSQGLLAWARARVAQALIQIAS